MRALIIVATAGLLVGGTMPGARADLGVSLDKARSVAQRHAARHGGSDPLFNADKSGRVVWECWAAPAQGWSREEAMALARDLLPSPLKREAPSKASVSGAVETYAFQDGTAILLRRGLRHYIGVEVRAPHYRGHRC